MNWLTNYVLPKIRAVVQRKEVPDNLWRKCPGCDQMLFHRELAANLDVCRNCGHHFRIGSAARFAQLFDDGVCEGIEVPKTGTDPLRFRDRKRYSDRLKEAQAALGPGSDAVALAEGRIGGQPAVVAAFDFGFMGGSMGVAVGEALLTAARRAVAGDAALIVVPSSGGARMQEGILSLMQLPRAILAADMVKEAGLPYIVLLTDPTTGGVSASLAMVGDIAIAEPGAIIGFAGARVIEETIREKLPEGFQRAEYLYDHGMVDMVVPRGELAATLGRLLSLLCERERPDLPALPAPEPGGGIGMSAAGSDAVLDRLTRLHPKKIDLSLGRIERLLTALGNPQERLAPVAHVAGTKGKGSTVAIMRACLEAAGYRVHAYISPHLVRFHERIRLAGTLIDEDALIALLEECERANGEAPITFFEITTAAAFLAFARAPADIVLLEVGVGGRLDATNVVAHPAVTAITPVSIDHQAFLGDTLPEIAGEKAGILKPGVPGIVAPQLPEAEAVIAARAAAVGAPLYRAGQEWRYAATPSGMHYQGTRWRLDLPHPSLLGAHQVLNAGTALAALETLSGFALPETALAAGLRRIDWPARLQLLRSGPLLAPMPAGGELWLDGGHNPAAGAVLGAVAADWHDRPLDLVVGMLNTKDAAGFLRPMAPFARSLQAVTIPGEDNALPAAEIAAAARAVGIAAEIAPSIADAVRALAPREPAGRILICGSLHLAGVVLRENG